MRRAGTVSTSLRRLPFRPSVGRRIRLGSGVERLNNVFEARSRRGALLATVGNICW